MNIKGKAASGQAAVEFALILVVLLAFVYGIIEISRLMLINAELDNASREATRYAAIHPGVNSAFLRTNVIAPRVTLLDVNSPDFAVSEPCFLRAASCTDRAGVGPFFPVQVTVTYTWRSLVNMVPDLNTMTLNPFGPLILRSQSTKLIEGR